MKQGGERKKGEQTRAIQKDVHEEQRVPHRKKKEDARRGVFDSDPRRETQTITRRPEHTLRGPSEGGQRRWRLVASGCRPNCPEPKKERDLRNAEKKLKEECTG